MKNMVLGITGIMASGKSSFCKALLSNGFQIISADDLVAELYQKDSSGAKALAALNISGIVMPDGNVDKSKLRTLMFSNSKLRKKINEAIHPIVIEEIKKLIQKKDSNKDPIAVEIPLLFEAKLQELCTFTVTIFREQNDATRSLMEKYNINVQEAQKMMSTQLSLSQKMLLSDFTILNIGNVDNLNKKAEILKRSVLILWKK